MKEYPHTNSQIIFVPERDCKSEGAGVDRRKKYRFINIYVPFLFIIVIFAVVLNGILSTEYIDDTEKFSNIYEEINKIPNTEKDIDNFTYDIYVVTESVNIRTLGEKLGTEPEIILYNNPYLIGKPVLEAGDRIVLYNEPVIFYKVEEDDTIEKITEKFHVKEEEILKSNPELTGIGIQNKKYLLIKNPVITENVLLSLKDEMVYENVAYNLNNQEKLIYEEKITGKNEIITQKSPEILEIRKNRNAKEDKNIQENRDSGNQQYMDKTNKYTKNNGSDEKYKNKEPLTASVKTKNSAETIERSKDTGYEINKYMLWPVSGTTITSGYGNRTHPILKTKKFHRGLDIRVGMGTPLKASFTGVVTYASAKGGYGNLIELERSDGIRVRYAHLDKISVNKGDAVKEGEVIGATGNTGLSTGPHLHFEILIDGEPVDPQKWNYF